MNASEFLDMLFAGGFATEATVLPCNDAEIREIEVAQRIALPAWYRAWLQLAGKCAGIFGISSQFYPELVTLKDEAARLLKDITKNRLKLPNDAFVCCMDAEEFLFFSTNDQSTDPPLTHYYIDNGEYRQIESYWSLQMINLQGLQAGARSSSMEFEFKRAHERCHALRRAVGGTENEK